MTNKRMITRALIFETAFTLFCEGGMQAASSVAIAKRLKCTTHPIFYYYRDGIEELRADILLKANRMLEEHLHMAERAGGTLEQICRAYIRFQALYPRIYEALFLLPSEGTANRRMEQFINIYEKRLAEANGLYLEAAARILQQTWLCMLGMLTARYGGHLPLSDEDVTERVLNLMRTAIAQAKAGERTGRA